MTQPYLQWFDYGTQSDTQIFPLLAGLFPLVAYLTGGGRVDAIFVIAAAAVVAIIASQGFSTRFDSYLLIRGIFGYVSLVLMTFAMIAFIRVTSQELLTKSIKVSFFVWALGGVLQFFIPGSLLLWREKLVQADGRGVLSFATEPSYFSIALLLLAVAVIAASGRGYGYLIVAVLISLFLAKSAVGAIYGIVALFLFARGSFLRKTAVAFAGLSLAALAILIQPEARISTVLRLVATDPWLLAQRDMSFGLRWINIELPVRGFVERYGLPHGLYEWGDFQRRSFLANHTDFNWQPPYTQFTSGRILSMHGRLLFELGAAAVAVYVFLWRLVRDHVMSLRLSALILVMGMNGLTLNSPFLSLILAIAYTVKLPLNDPEPGHLPQLTARNSDDLNQPR